MKPQTVESPVTNAEPILLDFLPQIPVVVQPSAGPLTSDAGLLPLRQFDQRWHYTQRMAACLVDPKPQRGQSLVSMLRQRLFGILAGYEDCNAHDTLRDDPIFKLLADRLPDGEALASQPTLSRFENLPAPAVRQKLIDFNITTGIERLKPHHGGQLPTSITLDRDATDDPTHGQQQRAFFHGYYAPYQYFPLIISEPTTRHVFLAWLRPGTVHASLGAEDDLMRVGNALRKERPDIVIHVRADAGFGWPRRYEICEQNHLTYTFGFATNARLKELTADLMRQAVAG
jgi:Transposase DDE domain group 1